MYYSISTILNIADYMTTTKIFLYRFRVNIVTSFYTWIFYIVGSAKPFLKALCPNMIFSIVFNKQRDKRNETKYLSILGTKLYILSTVFLS